MNLSAAHELAAVGRVTPTQSWTEYFRLFIRLAGPYFTADWRTKGLVTALVILTACQVAVQIALNLWTERLFDAFGTRSMSSFVTLAGVFALILASDVAIITTHLRVRRRIQVEWRKWLTQRLTGEWMTAGRHYRMNYIPGDHDNPDGRIAEDIRIATESAIDLGHSLLYCIMLLASFLHILWGLSGLPVIELGEIEIAVPGHLVWAALLYASIGAWVALLLGPPLISTAEARQTYEANFRFGLVHARENSAVIALVHGEAGERRRFAGLFQDVIAAWNRQTRALFHFYFFTSNWSVLSPIFPVLIAAPRYISGAITLGVLMQIAQAFQQAVAALSWPIDNLSHAAQWRASGERVLGLNDSIQRVKREDCRIDRHRIAITQSEEPVLALEDVSIVTPDGETPVRGLTCTFHPGERVWISGEAAAINALVKAVAGLWVNGSGRIKLPSDGPVYFMPPRSYLPPGPLRDALSYPDRAEPDQDERLRAAMEQAGVGHLIPRLDESDNWDEALSLEEHEALGIAQLIFHAPHWVIIQPADGLNSRGEQTMLHVLETQFARATVIIASHYAPTVFNSCRHIILPAVDNKGDAAAST